MEEVEWSCEMGISVSFTLRASAGREGERSVDLDVMISGVQLNILAQ